MTKIKIKDSKGNEDYPCNVLMVMSTKYKKVVLVFVVAVMIVNILLTTVHASEQKYFLGSAVNTGTNNGFSGSNNIGEKDSHFGWELGHFYVSGYTRVTGDRDTPIFIRTLGDEVTLNFNLGQDIDALNGDNNFSIIENNNAFDEYFGIERTNFGRGMLIIRHTDWRNFKHTPNIYTDYLLAKTTNADTLVLLLEEGDYEVALNYATRKFGLFGLGVPFSTNNYRIFFKFSVRNGESIVFPRDVLTESELTNHSITSHGFYLDLANSRFLDIEIRREILVQGADGLTEDTRFNRPARDGVQYTEDGIYTITARNNYTNQETVKRIYVGTDNILMAHMNTGHSIKEINDMISLGAVITDDGWIILPLVDTADVDNNDTEDENNQETEDAHSLEDNQNSGPLTDEPISELMNYYIIALIIGLSATVIVSLTILYLRQKNKSKSEPGGET